MKTADTHLDVLKTHKLYIGGQVPRPEARPTHPPGKPRAEKPPAPPCPTCRAVRWISTTSGTGRT